MNFMKMSVLKKVSRRQIGKKKYRVGKELIGFRELKFRSDSVYSKMLVCTLIQRQLDDFLIAEDRRLCAKSYLYIRMHIEMVGP